LEPLSRPNWQRDKLSTGGVENGNIAMFLGRKIIPKRDKVDRPVKNAAPENRKVAEP
jgi:hypothetical protein